MTKHAILGSRSYPDLNEVVLRVRQLGQRHGNGWILVSGGARGASLTAERQYQQMGGPVLSIRPVRLPALDGETRYGVKEYRFAPRADPVTVLHEIDFYDWRSAATYRSMLIAERADHGDIFWHDHSPGSAAEIDYFAAAETPLRVWSPGG